jgi:hypothetical protein
MVVDAGLSIKKILEKGRTPVATRRWVKCPLAAIDAGVPLWES